MSRPRGKPKQYEVFKALRGYQSAIGSTPSERTLSEMTGIPMNMVHTCMQRLEIEDGLIRRTRGSARHVEILGKTNLESVSQKYVKKALAIEEAKKKNRIPMNKSQAGKEGRGISAFIAKGKKKDEGLEKRINAVVAKALANDDMPDSEDVMLSKRLPWSRRMRVKSVRVG